MISAVFGAYQRTVRTMQRGTLSGSRRLMDTKGTMTEYNPSSNYVDKYPKVDEIKVGNRTYDIFGIFEFPVHDIVIKINSNKPFKDTTRVAFNLIPCDSSSIVISGLSAASVDDTKVPLFNSYDDLDNPNSGTTIYLNDVPTGREFIYKVIGGNTITLSDATVVVVNDGVELHFPGKDIYMTNKITHFDHGYTNTHKHVLGDRTVGNKNFTHECSAYLNGTVNKLNYEIIEYY